MDEQILSALLQNGLIDQPTLKKIRELVSRGKTLEQATVGGRYVGDVDFARLRAEALGLPFVDLANVQVSDEAFGLLPKQVVETLHIVPIGFDGTTLQVAMQDPQDIHATEAIELIANDKGWKLQTVVVPATQLLALLRRVGAATSDVVSTLAEAKGSIAFEETVKGVPVSRVVAVLMRQAVEGGATDIHIEPIGNESRVRYRIDGVLRTSLTLPLSVHPSLISRIKVLANLKIDETRIPQDGRMTKEINGKKIDFRVSTLPVVDNEKVVMRMLDTSVGAPTFEQLGYRKEHLTTILEELKKPFGLFLITGPTGSGKSTTLFAGLNVLNEEGRNTSTLEDPVGLRSLLHQDPSVIMVDETRDRETAESAIHASLNGHLIFSTIHTNDVFGLVSRLVDMGVEPFLLAATLNIGIAQRLVRKVCEHCKEPQVIAPETAETLRIEIQKIPAKFFKAGFDSASALTFMHGKGCARCSHSGYAGRTAVVEIFQFTQQAKRLVEKGFPMDEVRAEAARQGMLTIRQDALLKALDGLTTVEEVLRLSQETTESV